jgi:tetratricopeptide (TPR) repeat protein
MREQALFHLKKALSINIFDPMILLEMGRINLLDGEPQKAAIILESIESDPVVGIMAKFYLAQAYLEMHKLKLAKNYIKIVINEKPSLYPKAYFILAKIMSQERKPGLSSFYLGKYYSQIKNNKNAKFHLNKALDRLTDTKYIKKTEELLKQVSKKKKSTAKTK